jgi:hypothetical protein
MSFFGCILYYPGKYFYEISYEFYPNAIKSINEKIITKKRIVADTAEQKANFHLNLCKIRRGISLKFSEVYFKIKIGSESLSVFK